MSVGEDASSPVCDAVLLHSFAAGRLLEPGGPVFGTSLRRAEFELAVRSVSGKSST